MHIIQDITGGKKLQLNDSQDPLKYPVRYEVSESHCTIFKWYTQSFTTSPNPCCSPKKQLNIGQ